MPSIENLIKELKESSLYAECSCGEEFKISDSFLFDGTKPFPSEALKVQETLKDGLKSREEGLKKKHLLATKRATNTTRAVNIGKKLEVVLPTMKDFKWKLPDCRFLSDPLDFIAFNGFSLNNIVSLSFVEVKSGAAKLNPHQKAIKDAIEEKRVSYEVFE